MCIVMHSWIAIADFMWPVFYENFLLTELVEDKKKLNVGKTFLSDSLLTAQHNDVRTLPIYNIYLLQAFMSILLKHQLQNTHSQETTVYRPTSPIGRVAKQSYK